MHRFSAAAAALNRCIESLTPFEADLRDQNQTNEARYGVGGKGQADRRKEGDRYGEHEGEEGGRKETRREEGRAGQGRRGMGGGVHAALAGRAPLLAGQ